MIPPDQDIRNRLVAARLPAMPQILLKLLELCRADGAGMGEIAALVSKDAGLSTKLLELANSAAYQRSGRTTSLVQALGALGADLIKSLVINASVQQAINGFAGSATTDMRRFWHHALATAVMARDIARAMDYAQPEEAYLAGLLHDVGRLALLAAAPDTYAPHFRAEDSENLCADEQSSLQMTHAEAGAHVVARWNLDSFLADAILYHHESAFRLEAAHPLVRAVQLAHQLAIHDPAQPIAADAGTLCRLSGDSLLEICQAGAAQVHKAASFLGIDLSGLEVRAPAAAPAPGLAQTDAVQLRLGEEVRNLALLSAFAQALAGAADAAQVLKRVRQHAQLLLGLADACIFVPDGQGQSLACAAFSESHQRLAGFSIPLAADGLMAQAVRQQRLAYLDQQAAAQSLADAQLLRLFNADALLCLPLLQGGLCLGLLVGGLAAWQVAELQQRDAFVLAFAAQAAPALQAGTRADGEGNQGESDVRLQALRQEHSEQARRVVHEVNNPLAIIKNYLDVLDDKLARQEPVQGEIGVLHGEIERIGHIMGEYAGTAPRSPAPRTDINAAVNKLVRLLRESKFLPAAVEMLVRLPLHACEIDAAPDILTQILVNLVKNAVEALPRGGRIEIVNNGQVQRNGRAYYALSISDNGSGIPGEHRSQLFTPVRSSKSGSNRGIGLSIVHGLVKQLDGTIACVSTSTKGTLFELCLPLPGKPAQAAPTSAAQDFA